MIKVPCDKLTLNRQELKARLGGNIANDILPLISDCENEIRSAADCCYIVRETAVSVDGNTVSFDFAEVQSRDLAVNLSGCSSAFTVAVSLGHSVDRVLKRAAVQSSTKQFVTDAVASTLVEALCDLVQSELPDTKPRFSPGYGDLPLSFQRPLLQSFGNCGITLTDSCLMLPTKSVTFIAGRK